MVLAMVLSLLQLHEHDGLNPIRVGRIVRHRITGSRGVIVHADRTCARGDVWYRSRADRPRRDQPWFTILFDETESNGYFALEDLELAPLATQIEHPLLHVYFHAFNGREYLRNGRLWP